MATQYVQRGDTLIDKTTGEAVVMRSPIHIARKTILPAAERVMTALAPYCVKIEIAGSLRRGAETAHDAEIVCVPRLPPGRQRVRLVADWDRASSAAVETDWQFQAALAELVESGVMDYNEEPGKKANGPKLKRFVMKTVPLAPSLKLYIATQDNYGYVLALKTGDWFFSACLVKQIRVAFHPEFDPSKTLYGLRDPNVMRKGGELWRVPAVRGAEPTERIPTPDEASFFAAIKVPFIEPRYRTRVTLEQWWREGLQATPWWEKKR